MKRRGFTILELTVVIGIIAMLLTIVITSVQGSIKRARVQQANALCTMAQNGLINYHAQMGEWPWKNDPKVNTLAGTCVLMGDQVRHAMLEIVRLAKEENNPLMDISGLWVSTFPGEAGQTHYGSDFMTAVRGTKKNPKKHKASELYFGYPEAENGYFRRFFIIYYPITDSITVRTFTMQEEAEGWVNEHAKK